jgi:predicted nucleic acid-binding Zn finger protein
MECIIWLFKLNAIARKVAKGAKEKNFVYLGVLSDFAYTLSLCSQVFFIAAVIIDNAIGREFDNARGQ